MIDVNNKKFWNIVKGIGILSVVIGHCCSFLVPFVYLFHLTIFFFVGGYLYSEGKYGDSPYSLLVSRLKSSWKKYVLFGIFFILIHLQLLPIHLGLLYLLPKLILRLIRIHLLTKLLLLLSLNLLSIFSS